MLEDKYLKSTQIKDAQKIKNLLKKKQINESIIPIENIAKYYIDDKQSQVMKVKLIATQETIAQNYSIKSTNKVQNKINNNELISVSNQIKGLQEAKYRLEKTLSEAGFTDININFKYGSTSPAINLNAYESNKDKFQNKIKERLGTL
ncbi:hypothetical protein B0P06_006027 [Clostridium saccharoperbutylacetonicum]|uniref:Uncharacterized protein n=1 Tax=Clostridium saccharoperbutylacetonicum N1-4(HMT) TaxID=931276 RepID=M1MYJ4_9CLOT|nr:hypothetical protein [Clostridium saccharoperbutylacetonicum]AGF59591.1 hypothetical protein Cspa_135p00310 [Clostridium saccharoperbutylacetonicum N1-4(HMT)]NRT64552.1 hypothetical protein [Clostridium saccharoperbutylacetonicum]NSB29028.1 hypothetical protein [Clostridium saccharoperbutylacetonicum]NSB46134.1 hypothetical protein [Clostridium saccharoperbutylacetonicum]